MFRKISLAAALLAIGLNFSACSSDPNNPGFIQKVENVYNTVTGATVSPEAVVVIANTFNAIEITAKNYLLLPRCPKSQPVCRDPKATQPLIKAIRLGRTQRDNLEQFLADHPGQLGPSGLYDALNTSITAINDIFAQYNVKGVVSQ